MQEYNGKTKSIVIGIRIGNANSSIAYTNENGKTIIIANDEGERRIPSAISYLDGEEYHGLQAKAQLIGNSKNTVIHFKNLFGKKIDCIDSFVSEYSAKPSILNDKIVYTITSTFENETKQQTITVDEVMIRHLKYLKRCAEDYIGKIITDVVFTIPTDFSLIQIKLLEKCAENAGLNILQVIKEPIAEIFAYSHDTDYLTMTDKIYLVADFGESRSDVTIVAFRQGMYTIIETESNHKLGGKLLNDCLVEYFLKEFQKKYNLNPKNNLKAMAKLRAECETIKKSLSSSNISTISIECMFGEVCFEMLGKHVFNEMATLVENVLKKAHMESFDVDEVILAGGTSHIPKIAEMFNFIFPKKTLIHAQSLQTSTLSPSDIECYGAAIQASLISSFRKDELSDLINSNITCVPHLLNPIGVVIESYGETTFIPIINSYTAVPVQKSIVFDGPLNENSLCIFISQGIADLVPKNTETLAFSDIDDSFVQEKSRIIQPSQKIAECILENLLPNSKIQVTVHIDLELKITITAKSLFSTQDTFVKGEVIAYQKVS
ncbi:hypothetical protein PCANB_002219 [Pneumocystis canis]|nr:hypothetical protein PCANB_002219 [Pneumocystis canis]